MAKGMDYSQVMELTEYKVKGRMQWIDLYGNPYRRCTSCSKVKADTHLCTDKKDSIGLASLCRECQSLRDKKRMENPIEKEKSKQRVVKCQRNKGHKSREERLILMSLTNEYKHAPKTNLMLCHCTITGKDFLVRRSKLKPIVHPQCNIKGDYNRPDLLANAINKHGRFHICAHCFKSIDLIQGGFMYNTGNHIIKKVSPFCDKDCMRFHSKQSITESARRRRARMRTGVIETIRPEQIYKRDKYKCWICGCKVVSTYGKDARLNKDAATLDHIIPLAKGGTHTKENIKTACRQCNALKADKIIEGTQINIFTYASI